VSYTQIGAVFFFIIEFLTHKSEIGKKIPAAIPALRILPSIAEILYYHRILLDDIRFDDLILFMYKLLRPGVPTPNKFHQILEKTTK